MMWVVALGKSLPASDLHFKNPQAQKYAAALVSFDLIHRQRPAREPSPATPHQISTNEQVGVEEVGVGVGEGGRMAGERGLLYHRRLFHLI